jgi:very-short-patch-repair endonuclease
VREELANTSPDAAIARLAASQHGVVSIAQLERLGIRRQSLTRRVNAQRLHRIHRGVYAVGHPGLSEKGTWMAAVLTCGPQAVLSHASAAAHWRILRSPSERSVRAATDLSSVPVHVTVPGGSRSRAGIHIHRSRILFPSAVTRRARIPITTPSRTLTDLRRTIPQPQFEQALRQAEYIGLPIDPELDPDHTRSELEARFLGLCRRRRLPKPEVNVRVGSFIADLLWPGHGLIVELDGFRAHGTRSAFEADRARDVELKLLGYEVVRFTWRQLASEPAQLARTLRRLLMAQGQ